MILPADAYKEKYPNRTPWNELTVEYRRRWRAYVNSGLYEEDFNARIISREG